METNLIALAVAKATAAYFQDAYNRPGTDFEIPTSLLKPSFAELVQDRAAELITLDMDNRQRCRAVFEELYQAATRELANGK